MKVSGRDYPKLNLLFNAGGHFYSKIKKTLINVMRYLSTDYINDDKIIKVKYSRNMFGVYITPETIVGPIITLGAKWVAKNIKFRSFTLKK